MPEGHLKYDKDQVRERTDLVALIGQHVALRKRGARYLGLCPFHQEKSPSFNVDPDKGYWHCFGCGKGGDAFNFLMNLERLTFPEAVERLAERAGVRPLENSHYEPQRKEEKDHLLEANAAAAAAFRKALLGKAGTVARTYLERRGITAEHAERFGLGYAPAGWDALVQHLRGRGFAMDVLAKADLVRARSSGDGYIDRFRNRLMIPILDRQGRVVAFGGRALSKEDTPKYLNSGETPIFHKGKTLYLLNLALDTMKKRNRAIVTEGYFDAIACHLAGYTEAVATLGTALSEEHARDLRRLADRIYLIFDADSAGINAALRSQSIFRTVEADVRIVKLPAGHDPDTLLREQGADAFERCLADALSPVEFELDLLVSQFPTTERENRIKIVSMATKIMKNLSPIEIHEYSSILAQRLVKGTTEDMAMVQKAIMTDVKNAINNSPNQQISGSVSSAYIPENEVMVEKINILLMVHHSSYAQRAIARIPPQAFTNYKFRRIYEELIKLSVNGQVPDARHIRVEEEDIVNVVAKLALTETEYDERSDDIIDRLYEWYMLNTLKDIPDDNESEKLAATDAVYRELEKRRRRRDVMDDATPRRPVQKEEVPDRIKKYTR